jgi:hypothetical protein
MMRGVIAAGSDGPLKNARLLRFLAFATDVRKKYASRLGLRGPRIRAFLNALGRLGMSPDAALRCIPRRCDVPVVRLTPRDLRALPAGFCEIVRKVCSFAVDG